MINEVAGTLFKLRSVHHMGDWNTVCLVNMVIQDMDICMYVTSAVFFLQLNVSSSTKKLENSY